MKKRLAIILLALGVLGMLTGCNKDKENKKEEESIRELITAMDKWITKRTSNEKENLKLLHDRIDSKITRAEDGILELDK